MVLVMMHLVGAKMFFRIGHFLTTNDLKGVLTKVGDLLKANMNLEDENARLKAQVRLRGWPQPNRRG